MFNLYTYISFSRYENKGVQWLKSKPSLPPGLDSSEGSVKTQVNSSEPMSKAAKKNAKRKEKKKQQQDGNQSGTSIQNVTQSLAGININKDQSGAKSKNTDQSDSQVTKQSGESSDKQEIAKKLKNLRKKLKQIEDLEKKIQSGELKNPEKEQLEKIGKKKMILEEIEDLELDLDD
jgi:partner of Y14 and mago protein